ncbi:hypothetical protein Pfo_001258 [Paulownia fortunei]|nr:hypothetical protein Pfo_001258 [Paulownia fortunei]
MEEAKGYDAETEKESVGSSDLPIHDGKSNGAADQNHKPLIVHGRLTGPARRSSKANWTEEEDDLLRDAVQRHKGKSWKKIAEYLPGRTDVQCLHRWQKVLNPDLVKGPWNKEEDNLLIELVGKQGMMVGEQGKKKWSEIAVNLPGRIGKQCRERWFNHLNPEINKAAWTKEEEMILINAHGAYGNKWSEIAKILPGRTENSVKNHWNCSLKKKLDNYLASGSALNHPPFTIPALHGDKTETGKKFVEVNQNLCTNCLHKETIDSGNNGESCCLDSNLGYSGNSSSHLPSSGKANNPVRPLSSTCSKIELFLDDLSKTTNHATVGQPKVLDCTFLDAHGLHGHSCKPCLISSRPQETSSKYLPPYLISPPNVRCNDRNFTMSCSIRPSRHSDISDNPGRHQSASDWSYTGLCYEPIRKADLNIFLPTGRFPSTDSYIHQPNRSISVPPSRSDIKASSDLYSSPKSILRSAAMSYDKVPSIIRKRAIQTLQKGVSVTDKVVGSLNKTLAAHEVPKVDDDQVQTLRKPVLFSPKCQKLEKSADTKSVGKSLERAFSDA